MRPDRVAFRRKKLPIGIAFRRKMGETPSKSVPRTVAARGKQVAHAIGLALTSLSEDTDVDPPPTKKRRSDFGGTHEHPHADLVLEARHYCKQRRFLHLMTKTIKVSQNGRATYTSAFPTGFPDCLFLEKAADHNFSILAVEFKIGRDKLKPEQVTWFKKLRGCNIRYACAYCGLLVGSEARRTMRVAD